MNNRGFAISGIIYTILLIFIIALTGILSLFNSRKNVLDALKNKAFGEVNTSTSIKYEPFVETGKIIEFTARAKGYYEFQIFGTQMNNKNGSKVTTEIYLLKGDTLYFLIGSNSYNRGITEIRTDRSSSSSIIKVSDSVSISQDNINLLNINIENNVVDSQTGKILVNYLNKNRTNTKLNKVKYIKDCIYGSSMGVSTWSEIKAIVDGDNKALGKNAIQGELSYSNITDGSMSTSQDFSGDGEQCIIVDLERTYNLDSISIYHSKGVTYYENKTYVSSDGKNYDLVKMFDGTEDMNGVSINAYQIEQVTKVGSIYVPIKEFDNATWLRVFHHNNLSGTQLWSSVSQSNLENGYDTLYRQSILAYLNDYKNEEGFEFLLEYSDLTGYNRWKQSVNPVVITKSSNMKAVPGYASAKISWDSNGWGGLAKSSNGTALLDGSINSNNSFYAIGSTTSWNGGIMGPGVVSKGSVDLWVRIDK